MRTAITSLCVLAAGGFSATATAHSNCNIDIDGHMTIQNKIMTIKTDAHDEIVINGAHQVRFNGAPLNLNAQQQKWLSDYYSGIHNAVPEVAQIASEGVAIATNAIEQVFGELLGIDSDVVSNITQKMEQLDQKVQYSFYAEDGSIRLNSEEFAKDEPYAEAWEREFENAIEEVVAASMGHLMIAMGTELLMSGGDADEFEHKMERFGETIEETVESRAEVLGERAEALCRKLERINEAEDNLQRTVPEFAALNVLQVSHNSEAM